MELISYNLNGIRAAMKKDLPKWIKKTNYDIYCFQETKAHQDQVETDWIEKLGYHQYWFSAEKKGYSSVAVLTKAKPKNVIYGMGNKAFDAEGRSILLEYKNFALLNVYFPSGSSGEHRQEMKMKFLKVFLPYAKKLKKKYKNLIICGDYNIAHTEIDIHNPKSNKKSSGFLPEEREWLTKFFKAGFIDTFRHFHKDEVDHYSWWSFRANARANNKGWRIDYFSTSEEMEKRLVAADILPKVKHSDHCPLYLKIKNA